MGPLELFRVWRLWGKLRSIGRDKVMVEKLKSRKLLALVIGAVLTTVNGAAGILSDEMMQTLLNLVMVYIGGQGAVDAVAALKAK